MSKFDSDGSNSGEADLVTIFKSHRQEYLEAYLRRAGLADLELRAQWDLIPSGIQRVLPESSEGFGLIGGYRVGKTSALAALLRREAEHSVDRIMAEMVGRPEEDFLMVEAIRKGKLLRKPNISWINWPTKIPENRAKLFIRETEGEVEAWIQESLLNGQVTLVLDDIGADRQTAQDWSGEVLGRVIDERLRRGWRTYWTSNCNRKELVGRYGARTVSRLLELAQAVELPSLPAFPKGSGE